MKALALAIALIAAGCAEMPTLGVVITNAPASLCSPSKPGGGACP